MQPGSPQAIDALTPDGDGHCFVIYGDACSGVPGALHERKLAEVNAVLQRLTPSPDFIIFPGDEIVGLTADPEVLRAQWQHFLQHEMAWLDRSATPVYHSTGNHTAYDATSESIFRDVLGMPRNGPPGQEGLSYWVRRGDLLIVVVHTLWSGLGGEGHVETRWLAEVLREHADASHKLVVGHHPVYSVNGFSGAYQRDIGPEHATAFWNVLVDAGVLAYICSHILAFDVQVHRGVLQVTTAGAGTAHRMPDEIEYLHLVQGAIDGHGLRYQVLDDEGLRREALRWPMQLPAAEQWRALPKGESSAGVTGPANNDRIVAFRFEGEIAEHCEGAPQTLLSAYSKSRLDLPIVWIGLSGPDQRVSVIIGPEPGRSPHLWHGPECASVSPFFLEIFLHCGMGPGGILYRLQPEAPWSSLAGASAWGPERIVWPDTWNVGQDRGSPSARPFAGTQLNAWAVFS